MKSVAEAAASKEQGAVETGGGLASTEEVNWTMRFMLLMIPGPKAEAGVLPDEKLVAAMMKYNEDMMKAGALLEQRKRSGRSEG
jgi:hypothetical protein